MKNLYSLKHGLHGLLVDALFLLPGWLLLLGLDPQMAVFGGLPVAFLLCIARYRLWNQKPSTHDHIGDTGRGLTDLPGRSRPGNTILKGRIAIAVAHPIMVIVVTACIVSSAFAPLFGFLAIGGVLWATEVFARRQGGSVCKPAPIISTGFFVLGGVAVGLLLLEGGLGPWPSLEFIKRLSTAHHAPNWTQEAKRQAIRAVREVLNETREVSAGDLPKHRAKLATRMHELLKAENPNGVYVTLYTRNGVYSRGSSSGGTDALTAVLRAASLAKELEGKRGGESTQVVTIQMDVAGPERSVTRRPFFQLFSGLLQKAHPALRSVDALGKMFSLSFEIEPGVDGMRIRYRRDKRLALVLPADPVIYGWLTPRIKLGPAKLQKILQKGWEKDTGDSLWLENPDLVVTKFRTTSFLGSLKGEKIHDLYRGNVLISKNLDRDLLMARIESAIKWLSRQVIRDETQGITGRFLYELHPPYRRQTRDYSLPRHAGAVYVLFAFYQAALTEPKFYPTAQRVLDAGLIAFEYMNRSLGFPEGQRRNGLCFLESNGNATSGATALAAMAAAELPSASVVTSKKHKSSIGRIAIGQILAGTGKCMLSMIDPEGAVFHNYREAKNQDRVVKEPLYFPGEVMLALVRLYRKIGDEKLLEGAIRIANRQIRKYNFYLAAQLPRAGDHWIIQALAELAEVTKDMRYARLSFLLGRGFLREQLPPMGYFYPDYRGAYFRAFDVPRTTRAASRSEAIGGAIRSARLLGVNSNMLETALVGAARHLIEQQFTVINRYFIPENFDVEGAIRMGIVDNHCRIDNNQHAIIALLNALTALESRQQRISASQ